MQASPRERRTQGHRSPSRGRRPLALPPPHTRQCSGPGNKQTPRKRSGVTRCCWEHHVSNHEHNLTDIYEVRCPPTHAAPNPACAGCYGLKLILMNCAHTGHDPAQILAAAFANKTLRERLGVPSDEIRPASEPAAGRPAPGQESLLPATPPATFHLAAIRAAPLGGGTAAPGTIARPSSAAASQQLPPHAQVTAKADPVIMPAPWDAPSEPVQPASLLLPVASSAGATIPKSLAVQRQTAEPAQELTVAEPAVAAEPFVLDLTNIRCGADDAG